MHIILAFDSFKDCKSALELGRLTSNVLATISPNIHCEIIPMADGGEGSLESLIHVDSTKSNIELIQARVSGPNYTPLDCHYGLTSMPHTNKPLAIIEIALCSGYSLANPKNPYYTTTYGIGELILHALDRDIRDFIICLGGSATNDAGIGMLRALGMKFLDSDGIEIKDAIDIDKIVSFDFSHFDSRIKESNFKVACDVNNPFSGQNGASLVFGMQKGATLDMARKLDSNFHHFANVIKNRLGKDIEIPGSGAAGGLGGAFVIFLNASLQSGAALFMQAMGLDEKIQHCDIVITGEGKSDSQTKFGKTPYNVLMLAKKYNKQVYLLSGRIDNRHELESMGFAHIYEISPRDLDKQEAMAKVDILLKERILEAFAWIK